jgi:hypothetical protein
MTHWSWHILEFANGGLEVRVEKAILGIMVILLVILACLAQAGGGNLVITTKIEVMESEQLQVRLDYALSSTGYSKSVNILTYAATETRDDEIHIFYEPSMVDSQYVPRISGLYDHMNSKLKLYGYEGSVSLVDRDGLEGLFMGPNSTLILASQPSNATALAQTALDWVMEGGVLVGIGESVPFVYDPRYHDGEEDYLALRYENLTFRSGEGMSVSAMADAFQFETVAPTKGIVVDDIESQGGKVMGYTYSKDHLLTSSALFRIGNGRLLTLSGDMSTPILTSGEEAYANDIAKLLAGWALWMEGEPFLKKITCGPESTSGIIVTELPLAENVVAISLDADDFQDVFQRSYVNINI